MVRFSILFIICVGVSVTVPAQETKVQPHWVKDSRTGCNVWNSYPLPKISIAWLGECKDGKANGLGILQWYDDGQTVARYKGEVVDGKRVGRGEYSWGKGNRYVGPFEDDLAHGFGYCNSWKKGRTGRCEYSFGKFVGWLD